MDKALIRELKAFLRERKLSLSLASNELNVSPGTLSKILRGNIACLSADRQGLFNHLCRVWMDTFYDSEQHLYTTVYAAFKQVDHAVAHQVLNHLRRDL
jgi:transcriptional regulator with XRE-family HTH domain